MCKDMCAENATLAERLVRTTHKTKDVQLLRLYTFLLILKKNCTSKADTDVVVEAMKQMKQLKNVRETRIYDAFSRRKVCLAWEEAGTMMVNSYAEVNTRVAKDGKPTCHICVENVPDFMCVHGKTAHSGICGSCALRIVLEPSSRCPICSQRVRLICIRSSSRAERLQVFDP
ncbi:unnamed protein product [Ectocarpus sp. 6 AP-2014]